MNDELPFRFLDDAKPRPRLVTPDLAEAFLVLVLVVAGTVTAPEVLRFGETSGLGVWTVLIAAGAGFLWLAKPWFPRDLVNPVLPLAAFVFFAFVSVIWGGKASPTAQNLSVTLGVLAFLLVTAREVERLPRLPHEIHRAMDIASLTSAIAYSLVVLIEGRGGELFAGGRPVFLARPFALFAMLCVARQVSRWLAGDKRGLWMALWLLALVFLSDGRTAMITCLALFPLGFLLLGDRKSVATGVGIAGLAAAIFVACITFSQDFNDRFFKYDASLQVGGVAINASGRTKMWELVLEKYKDNWLFGRGVSTCSRLIEVHFPGLGHPHNDYLRYLYEFGAFGLTLFLLFMVGSGLRLFVSVRRSALTRDGALAIHMTPMLALVAVMAAMMTDNPVIYVYMMIPLAILIGCSLGVARITPRASVAEEGSQEARSALQGDLQGDGLVDDADFVADLLAAAPLLPLLPPPPAPHDQTAAAREPSDAPAGVR